MEINVRIVDTFGRSTLFSQVSELFRDVSIGNSLQISLIRLIILEEEEVSHVI